MAFMIVLGLFTALCITIPLVCWFGRRITLLEVLAPFLISPLISLAIGSTIQAIKTRDIEFHGTWVTSTTHQEDWTEWREVDDYCERQVSNGTDSNGRTSYRTERYKCGSHIEYTYHPDEYYVYFASRDWKAIDREHYEQLYYQFGPAAHNRSSGHHSDYHRAMFHIGSGYLHTCIWPGTDTTFQPATLVKTYKNKVQAAQHSIFHFRTVTAAEVKRYQLIEYPELHDYYVQDVILTGGAAVLGPANERLKRYNARLGPLKQVKMFIFLYYDQPIEAAITQRNYMQGGNKNEFILCVGLNRQGEARWAYPITWCEDRGLSVQVRDYALTSKQLDLEQLVEKMAVAVSTRFVRKQFKDFNYLEVELPAWGYVLNLLICALVNGGIGYWIVQNYYTEDWSRLARWCRPIVRRRVS